MTWADVKKELIAIAHAFDVPITADKIRWYCSIWDRMGPDKVMDGLRKWGMNAKVRRLPLPGEITDQLSGEEVAGKILLAVRNFGYMRPLEAKEFLGDAWSVVQNMGGWDAICKYDGERGVLIAQCRDFWDKTKGATNGAYGRISGRDQPQDTIEGAGSKLRDVIRGISDAQGPHIVDGPKDPPDKES